VSQFGTDRTFTLIGLLGYIFFVIDPKTLIPFIIGGCLLIFLLAVYYFQKIKMLAKYGLTSVLFALITYSLTPLTNLHATKLACIIYCSYNFNISRIKGYLI